MDRKALAPKILWSTGPMVRRTFLNVAGSGYLVLATAPETNGAYSKFEIFVPPSAGTPLHAPNPFLFRTCVKT